jgi:hypothetical protein
VATVFVGLQIDPGVLASIMEEADRRGFGYTVFVREIIMYATKGGTNFNVVPPDAPTGRRRRRTAASLRSVANLGEEFMAGVRAHRSSESSGGLSYEEFDRIQAEPDSPTLDWESRSDRFTNPASPDYVRPSERMVNTFSSDYAAPPVAPSYPEDPTQMAGEDDSDDRV